MLTAKPLVLEECLLTWDAVCNVKIFTFGAFHTFIYKNVQIDAYTYWMSLNLLHIPSQSNVSEIGQQLHTMAPQLIGSDCLWVLNNGTCYR